MYTASSCKPGILPVCKVWCIVVCFLHVAHRRSGLCVRAYDACSQLDIATFYYSLTTCCHESFVHNATGTVKHEMCMKKLWTILIQFSGTDVKYSQHTV